MNSKEFALYLDHSYLKPFLTYDDIRKGCDECKKYEFKTISVHSGLVEFCAKELKGTEIGIDATVGFPLGILNKETKKFETEFVFSVGATEVDTVINIGALKSGDFKTVKEDVEAVVAGANGKCVKVILENAYLTDQEKIDACKIIEDAGADFVKTSTGFASSGATFHDAELMLKSVSSKMKVKVAGGVNNLDDALKYIEMGIQRIGTRSSVALVEEFIKRYGK